MATTVGEGAHRQLVAVLVPGGQGAPSAEDRKRAAAVAGLERPTPPSAVANTGAQEAELVERALAALLSRELGFTGSRSPIAGLGAAPEQRPLLDCWLAWLAARQVVHCLGEDIAAGPRWVAAPPPADLAARLPTLAAILRGEREPLVLLDDDLLAPEALLDADPRVRARLTELTRQLTGLAARLGRPLQIGELAARSGRTARQLLAQLAPETSYTLLEPSAALLALARERLSGLPQRITYQAPGELVPEDLHRRFDVLLCNHGLHRLPDLPASLARLRLLCAPGAVMLAIESAELSPLALLSAAVLERGFADLPEERRARRHPLLEAGDWTAALNAAGWSDPQVAQTAGDPTLLLRAGQPLEAPSPSPTQLRARLAERLPAHMIPERLGFCALLPLNANGKVDRRRIGEMFQVEADLAGEALATPEGPVETAVAGLWAELLGSARIGRQQSFFALGGDSLLATRLVEGIRQRFGVELPLRTLFGAPTVAALAALIAGAGGADPAIEDGVL